MPDWQALDAHIARKVMGWLKWDELPIIAQMNYLAILPRKPDPFRLARLRKSWWAVSNECAYIELCFAFDWQPHKDVAQSMLALRTLLVKIGRHATATLCMAPAPGRCRLTIQNWVATGETRAMCVRGPYVDTEQHAICLALEQWTKEKRKAHVS